MQTNICETCGGGKWTVTHHEAPHRCPVCALVEAHDAAVADADDLRGRVAALETKVEELEEAS
jgi:hypothetical protein